jgi:hypothetical protein
MCANHISTAYSTASLCPLYFTPFTLPPLHPKHPTRLRLKVRASWRQARPNLEHVDHLHVRRAVARPVVRPPCLHTLALLRERHNALQVALARVGLDQLRVLLPRNCVWTLVFC